MLNLCELRTHQDYVCELQFLIFRSDEVMNMIYPEVTDEEVDVMYEDYSIAEAIKERMRNDEDYRYA